MHRTPPYDAARAGICYKTPVGIVSQGMV